jgi:3-oxoacyl-[acyl-carrier protein] reductase
VGKLTIGITMEPLKNQIALVTGASRGIGQAIALELAKQGAYVAGTATTQAGADKITALFTEHALQGHGFVLDVNNVKAVEASLATLKAQKGGPTILINNAAVTRDNLMLRMKEEEWQTVLDTNLTAVFRLTKLCLKDMLKARFGRIITISSVVAATGNPGQANYTAAKAGVIAFSKSLAQEIASRGITVNVIAPGFIETDMTHVLSDEQKAAMLSKIPTQTLGQPADIAKACLFLALPETTYITGHTLHVNGGMYMN